MLSVLPITVPIFSLVALGYVLTRLRIFSARDMGTLGNFVMYLALPALLFRATATRQFDELVDPGFFITLCLAGLSTQALIWILLRTTGVGPARRALGVMGAATPNSAFLAFPIMQMVYPELAPQVLAMCLLAENVLLTPIGLVLLEAANPREQRSALRTAGQLALAVLKRPMIVGLILGALVSVSGLPLPTAVDRSFELIALAASPLALFVIGGSLVGLPLRGNLPLAGTIAAFKLGVHPLFSFLLLGILPLVGLAVPQGDLAIALILSTAMPIFGVFPLLAQNSGHSGAASLAVMLSTLAAFFSLTLLIALIV